MYSKKNFSKIPRVAIIATGGTIAGKANDASNTLNYLAGAVDISDLLVGVSAELPDGLKKENIQFETMDAIDSKDITLGLWQKLSARVNTLLAKEDIDGVIVTHGTDTLEETAYWLHLTINSVKPVVLTAAMRPATALSADGPANLFDALTVASHPLASHRGVLVVFANKVFSARHMTKIRCAGLDAFTALESGIVGWVQDKQVDFIYSPKQRHTVNSEFLTQYADKDLPCIEIVAQYASASTLLIDALIENNVAGIVVAGTGNGSISNLYIDALKKAVSKGIIVVRSTRVLNARVTSNDAIDEENGFIASGTLNAYQSRILLMLALAHRKKSSDMQKIFTLY